MLDFLMDFCIYDDDMLDFLMDFCIYDDMLDTIQITDKVITL